MNKKKVFLWVIIIFLIIYIFTTISFKGEKTLEAELLKTRVKTENIVHIEYVTNGAFVFNNRSPGFEVIFVKKSILGWEYNYNLVQGDLSGLFKRAGLSFSNFPKFRKVPFPLYFGVIDSPKIQAVEVKYNTEMKISKARIIEKENIRLWIAQVIDIDDSDVVITGLSKEGEEVSRVTLNGDNNQFEIYYEDK